VLVSPATGDDAAVYVLPGAGDLALIQTVDFFTPIVDDPFDWGRIAAANALSDVYAMGGRPVTALNLAAWPVTELSLDLLADVLEGGATVARLAGVTIVGGHTIHDPEPKYGMAVTGFVHPDRVVRNSTMRPGDRLVLTKPLGIGIITTAIKREEASQEQTRRAVDLMATLNREAAAAMIEVGVSAATDVTGFGLVGHLHIALEGSEARAVLDASRVPLLAGTLGLAERGVVPDGTRSNHLYVSPTTDWGALPKAQQLALADAQTSGGLLIAVPENRAAALFDALELHGVSGVEIGAVEEGHPGHIGIEGLLAE
jgi:selenide,water dikinase